MRRPADGELFEETTREMRVAAQSSFGIEVVIGDITEQATDAIVNAANSQLFAGGGVCGAIFAKAGPELGPACAAIGGCPTGEARLTPGFGIPVKGIIHAVGPSFGAEGGREAALLVSAWRNSLRIADESGFRSVAFPSISTGIYGYPLEDAATVVGRVLADFAQSRVEMGSSVELVRIVVRDERTKATYEWAIERGLSGGAVR